MSNLGKERGGLGGQVKLDKQAATIILEFDKIPSN